MISNFLRAILALSTLLVIASCDEKNKEPIRVGTNLWVGYEPLYLAQHLNYFDEVDVSLLELPSASDVINAFRNGLVDCATLTLDETYTLLQEGHSVSILFIMDISNGGDVLLAKPDIEDISQLKGKRVAVENTAVGAYVLNRALDKYGLSTDDVSIVPMVASGHRQLYTDGNIDAVVTFEPARTQILELGAHELFSSKQIPNEIIDIFVVHTDMLTSRHEELEKLKKAWYKSLAHFKNRSEIMYQFNGERLKFTQEQLSTALEGIKFPEAMENDTILSGSFIQSAERVKQTMLEAKLLTKDFDVSELLPNKP